MLLVPQKGIVRVQQNAGSLGTATIGTSVTTGSSSGTKGAIAQLIAATLFETYQLVVLVDNYAAATIASQGCLDIMVGSSGSERVLIPNLLFGNAGGISSTAKHGPKMWKFPLYIPNGTRISAQAAGDRVSQVFGVTVYCYGGDGLAKSRVGTQVVTYGISAVPAGTTVVPGASGADGAWTALSSGTQQDHFAYAVSFQESGGAINLRNYSLDLGVGSSGNEHVIGDAIWFQADTNETMQGPFPGEPCFCDVPAGTRIALKASNSGTNDAGVYNAAVHAVS